MFSTLFNTSYLVDILVTAGIIIALIGCIFVKPLRLIVGTILICGVLATGIYSGINVYEYYTSHGGIHGTPQIDKVNQLQVDNYSFELSNIMLTSNGKLNEYEAKFTSTQFFELNSDFAYTIYVNGIPCDTIEYAKDYAKSKFSQAFYNENQSIILKDTINMSFAFYPNSIILTLKTTGGAQAVNLWNDYFSKNKMTILIKQEQSFESANDLSRFVKVTYIAGSLTKNYLIPKNSTVEYWEVEETDRYVFNFWTLDGETEVDVTNMVFNENTTLYANLTYKWVVRFFVQNATVNTQYYLPGENVYAQNYIPSSTAYTFLYWTLDGETEVNVNSYVITKDTDFIAKISINVNDDLCDYDKAFQYAFNTIFSYLHPEDIENVSIDEIGELEVEFNNSDNEIYLKISETQITSNNSATEYYARFTYSTDVLEEEQITLFTTLNELLQEETFSYNEFKNVFDSIIELGAFDEYDSLL